MDSFPRFNQLQHQVTFIGSLGVHPIEEKCQPIQFSQSTAIEGGFPIFRKLMLYFSSPSALADGEFYRSKLAISSWNIA
jgi:hypothetical protein